MIPNILYHVLQVLSYCTRVMENWMSTNGFSSQLMEGDNNYYYYKVKEILEAFPNKGPPFLPARLCHHLYMGSLRNAEDINLLKKLGITHVLNVTGTRRFDLRRSPYDKESGVKEFLMMPAEDHDEYDMQQHFTEAFAFLDDCKEKNGKAFLHCNLGVNRSGAIAAAYLMFDQKLKLLETMSLLKTKRSVVLCNKNFRRQLIQFARTRGCLDPVTIKDIEDLQYKKKKLMKEEFHPEVIIEYMYNGNSSPRKKYSYEEAPRGVPAHEERHIFSFHHSRDHARTSRHSESMVRPLRVDNSLPDQDKPTHLDIVFEGIRQKPLKTSDRSASVHTIAVHIPKPSSSSTLPRHSSTADTTKLRPHSLYMDTLDPKDKTYHSLPRVLLPREQSSNIAPHSPVTYSTTMTSPSASYNYSAPLTSPSVRSYSAPLASPSVRSYSAPLASPSVRNYSAPLASPSVRNYSAPLASPSVKNYSTPLASPSVRNYSAPLASPSVRKYSASLASPSVSNYSASLASPSPLPSPVISNGTRNYPLPVGAPSVRNTYPSPLTSSAEGSYTSHIASRQFYNSGMPAPSRNTQSRFLPGFYRRKTVPSDTKRDWRKSANF